MSLRSNTEKNKNNDRHSEPRQPPLRRGCFGCAFLTGLSMETGEETLWSTGQMHSQSDFLNAYFPMPQSRDAWGCRMGV